MVHSNVKLGEVAKKGGLCPLYIDSHVLEPCRLDSEKATLV